MKNGDKKINQENEGRKKKAKWGQIKDQKKQKELEHDDAHQETKEIKKIEKKEKTMNQNKKN